MADPISSPHNERLKLVRALQSPARRRRLGLLVAEGEDLVEAARAAGIEPVDLLVAGENVTAEALAAASALPHPARAIGVYRSADLPRLSSSNTVSLGLALWRVADPGNVGTLIRAADAFGAAVGLSTGCGELGSPKALRASAGAVFRVRTAGFDDVPGRRVALVPRGGTPLPELDPAGGVCLVLGAEREGLSPEVLEACDETVSIPMAAGAESLNVAAAGAIALYACAAARLASSQERREGDRPPSRHTF